MEQINTKEKLKFEKEELEHSTTLIVQQLQNVQDKDVIELSKLPCEQRQRIRTYALKELAEDVEDNFFATQEIEKSLKQIEERENK